MPLTIKDEGSVPSERWQYFIAPISLTVYAPNYPALYPAILEACRINNVAPPSQQDVINWVCANLKIACVETETRKPLINKFTLGLPAPAAQGCCGSR